MERKLSPWLPSPALEPMMLLSGVIAGDCRLLGS
jgi:hypothetical protein